MKETLAQLRDLAVSLGGRRVFGLTDVDLREALALLRAVVASLSGVEASLAHEAHARGLAQSLGYPSTTSWLRDSARMSRSEVKRARELGALLDARPALAEAVAAGEVSGEQALAIGEAITPLPPRVGQATIDAAEQLLISDAATFAPHELRVLGGRVLALVAPEIAEDELRRKLAEAEKKAYADRGLTFTSDPVRQRTRVTGLLTAEMAAIVTATLEPLARPRPVDPTSCESARRAAAGTDSGSAADAADAAVSAVSAVSAVPGLPAGAPLTEAAADMGADNPASPHDAAAANSAANRGDLAAVTNAHGFAGTHGDTSPNRFASEPDVIRPRDARGHRHGHTGVGGDSAGSSNKWDGNAGGSGAASDSAGHDGSGHGGATSLRMSSQSGLPDSDATGDANDRDSTSTGGTMRPGIRSGMRADDRTPAQRRADALVEVCRAAMRAGNAWAENPDNAQPHSGQPHSGQSHSGQPHSGQPEAGKPGVSPPETARSETARPCAGHPYAEGARCATGSQDGEGTRDAEDSQMSSGHGTVHAKTAACEGAKGVGRSSGASRPASGLADRPQLTVMVSYDMLAREIGRGTLDTGQMLTPETVRRMACDARVLPAVMGGAGQVLDLGRAQRTWTGPARRAVILRDQGCVFPSCDRTASWCDVHHIKHWSRGGPTDLTNGALLCGFHHQLVHHSGWQIRMAPDGRPEIVPPMWIDPLQRPLRNRYHRRP